MQIEHDQTNSSIDFINLFLKNRAYYLISILQIFDLLLKFICLEYVYELDPFVVSFFVEVFEIYKT